MYIVFKCVVIKSFIQLIFKIVAVSTEHTRTGSNTTIPNLNMDNWTSCEEFLGNTSFDKSKVVDVDWKIFYFWNFELENTYHLKFRVPSRILTDRFRVELDDEINPPVNWTEAELFMETSIDFSALYIRTDTPGKFRLIPSLAFQVKSVPYLIFALKYVEPGYLGIMNCKHRLCYALAPVDRMPKPEDLKLEADKIGFYSEHGRSYLVKADPRPSPAPFSRDDADNDEDLDILEHGFQGNYLDDEPQGIDDDDEE